MNYQSVKIFLAIVEHRSISAAARALYLTQPAVSGHLNRRTAFSASIHWVATGTKAFPVDVRVIC